MERSLEKILKTIFDLIVFDFLMPEMDGFQLLPEAGKTLKSARFLLFFSCQGFAPKQITNAVVKAIRIASASGMDINKNFRPVFSGIDREIIQDCKLS